MASHHHMDHMVGVAESTPSRDSALAIDPAAIHAQCKRILDDPHFSHSKRYSPALKYIVDRTLEGKHDCLKERIIGIEVFGRPNDYDTNQDATVRVAIAEVRKRLTHYYEEPGHQNELRIELQTGSYVAEFALPKDHSEKRTKPSRRHWLRKLYFAVPAVVIVSLFVIWRTYLVAPTRPIDRFWDPLLNSSSPVLISIAMPASGSEWLANHSSDAMGKFLVQQKNYPIPDIGAANSISAFLTRRGKQSVISLAQSTNLSELHQAPAVVLGSSQMNQWVLHLGSNLHFRFQEDGFGPVHWIQDTSNPTNRSWAVDLGAPYNQITNEYALITREFNITTGQWWIGIGSTTGLGTIGASRILMDQNAMKALNAQFPKGWEYKNVQIVVEFKVVDGSLGASHVIATYLW